MRESPFSAISFRIGRISMEWDSVVFERDESRVPHAIGQAIVLGGPLRERLTLHAFGLSFIEKEFLRVFNNCRARDETVTIAIHPRGSDHAMTWSECFFVDLGRGMCGGIPTTAMTVEPKGY